MDIQTNRGDGVWVSIGAEHLNDFAGDANTRGSVCDHTITWKPRKAWPDNKVPDDVKAVLSAWALNVPSDYMAVAIVTKNTMNFYTSAENVPGGVANDMYKTECLLMRKIPAANVQ